MGRAVATAVCLQRQATASQRPAWAARPRPAAITAAVMGSSMNTSKPAAWVSAGKKATLARRKRVAAPRAALRLRYRRCASAASMAAVAARTRAATARTGRRSRLPVSSATAAYTYGTTGGFRSAVSW
jgi:hypothetical protein